MQTNECSPIQVTNTDWQLAIMQLQVCPLQLFSSQQNCVFDTTKVDTQKSKFMTVKTVLH